MRRLLLVVLLGLAGCFEVIDLSPPDPDAGPWSDATFEGDGGVAPDAAPADAE